MWLVVQKRDSTDNTTVHFLQGGVAVITTENLSSIMRPLIHDLIVVEVSSHTAKLVPVKSYNSFLDQRSRKVIV